jgi:hypothetical protein
VCRGFRQDRDRHQPAIDIQERSQVELDGVGFLATAAFDTLLKKFRFGDAWTLEHLKRAAEHGPIDWAEEERSDPLKQSK